MGPFGPDKGKGGKFLLLPPEFQGDAPEGYFASRSKTNKVVYLGRAFVKEGNIAAAGDTLKKIRVYPLSQKNNPPEAKIGLSNGRPLNSIAPRGFEYWERVVSLVNSEPIEERNRFFHAFSSRSASRKENHSSPMPARKRS